MTNSIVSLSYNIELSKKYKEIKLFTYNILENNAFPLKKYFDFCMIFLVLSTIGILIFEVNHQEILILDGYEYFAIFVFIVEWLGRLWVSSDVHRVVLDDYEKAQVLDKKYDIYASLKTIAKEKFKFIFSPMSIIDLLAILPYYRPLRVLRIFLLFRLFKILRYTNSIKQFSGIFIEKRFELLTLAMLYSMVVFFSATIMFVYEGTGINSKINDFFDAIYWSIITISTVGYGDVTPMTVEGRLVTLVLVISGFLVIAFGTSIITTGLVERMETIKEQRVEAEASKMDEFTIICGYGIMGSILAPELEKTNTHFLIIDIEEERIKKAKKDNFLAVRGDATNMSLLKEIGINKGAKNILALTDNDAINLSIILSAKTLNPDINIIARANKEQSEGKFKIAGANRIISVDDIISYVAAEYVGQPVAFDAIDDILLNNDIGAVVDEIEVFEGTQLIGKKINSFDFLKYNLTLIGIVDYLNKQQFVFNPLNSDYVVKEKDILIVIGYKTSISDLRVDLMANNGGNES